MKTRKVVVPAANIRVGDIVDDRSEGFGPLEVLSVDAFCNLGKITYTISVGRNNQELYEAELLDCHSLTYTYVVKD